MNRPGPRNSLTDVPGLAVGQAVDSKVRTGVTVILPDCRAVCAVDVRGGGPGTRETDALDPENLIGATVDAVVLSGDAPGRSRPSPTTSSLPAAP
jgi:L-aminopeptidase/D-esterase-like protein